MQLDCDKCFNQNIDGGIDQRVFLKSGALAGYQVGQIPIKIAI
jgi:hypothetical protein